MGMKLNTLYILHNSKQFLSINFFDFFNNIWRNYKLNFSVGYPGALPITPPARFALASMKKDNKNINQALLVSAQLAETLPIQPAEKYPPGIVSFSQLENIHQELLVSPS